jgi:hypothetical protein
MFLYCSRNFNRRGGHENRHLRQHQHFHTKTATSEANVGACFQIR